ncbi:MAG: DUF2155 domain-containing protein [Amylibacter sp.]
MIRAITFVFGVLVAMPVFAQSQIATENSTAAELRTLDTLTGVVKDMTIEVGQTQSYERLKITVQECRYPKDNPSSDAFAYLIIQDVREDQPRFDAWMIASSPALSALEHPRYDVWLLRCKISDG